MCLPNLPEAFPRQSGQLLLQICITVGDLLLPQRVGGDAVHIDHRPVRLFDHQMLPDRLDTAALHAGLRLYAELASAFSQVPVYIDRILSRASRTIIVSPSRQQPRHGNTSRPVRRKFHRQNICFERNESLHRICDPDLPTAYCHNPLFQVQLAPVIRNLTAAVLNPIGKLPQCLERPLTLRCSGQRVNTQFFGFLDFSFLYQASDLRKMLRRVWIDPVDRTAVNDAFFVHLNPACKGFAVDHGPQPSIAEREGFQPFLRMIRIKYFVHYK